MTPREREISDLASHVAEQMHAAAYRGSQLLDTNKQSHWSCER